MVALMTAAIKEIDSKTLKAWLEAGECELLDVREPGEHAREKIPGARLVPLGTLDPQALAGRRVVLHCASGARSARGAARLADAGVDVAHLSGGIAAWRRDGLPVAEDRSAPIPIQRQVQIVAGTLALAGTLLGAFVDPHFYIVPGAVGAGLAFAGLSGTCMMASLLARLPYNRV